MDPGPGRAADAVLHDVDEGGDVVVGDPLALGDRGHEARRRPSGADSPARLGVGRGHDAEGGPRLGGQQLDLQPCGAMLGLVGEERRHLRHW